MDFIKCPKCKANLEPVHNLIENDMLVQDWYCLDCDIAITTTCPREEDSSD